MNVHKEKNNSLATDFHFVIHQQVDAALFAFVTGRTMVSRSVERGRKRSHRRMKYILLKYILACILDSDTFAALSNIVGIVAGSNRDL